MPISFKGFAQFSALTAMPPGTLVSFDQDGALLLGIVQDYDKPKYLVIDLHSQSRELVAERLHKLPTDARVDKMPDQQSKLRALDEAYREAQTMAQAINVEQLWQTLQTEQGEYDTSELCKRCFKRDTLSEHLALRIALNADRVFFRRKKDIFSPRSFENIAELRRAEEQRRLEQLLDARTVEFVLARLASPACAFPEECRHVMQCVEEIAADAPHTDNARKRRGKELLQRIFDESKLELIGSLADRAWQLLLQISWFDSLTDAALVRHRPADSFSEEVLKQAESIQRTAQILPAFSALERAEFRSSWCVSIDDASTKDADDAVSLDQTQDGFVLGIHITDVASYLPCDSQLDLEARKRATSIYLAQRTFNMLPEKLSEEGLSLQRGAKRACLSFLFDVDHLSRVAKPRVQSSWVTVQERLSYEQADELLEQGHAQLCKLYEIATGLEAQRFKQGGFRVNKREVGIRVLPRQALSIFELDEAAPGRSLVAELMVLANRAMAEFAIEHKLPIIFRGQREPDSPMSFFERIPEGPARDFSLRSKLQRSITGTEPSKHATLGLKAYTQATSPLRRYLDLVNQRQLLSFLQNGKAMYSAAELRKLIADTEGALKQAVGLTRESKRFWLLRFLEQEYKVGDTLEATVVRCDKASPMLELDRIYIIALARCDHGVRLGDRLKLKINAIDARYDVLKLESVR